MTREQARLMRFFIAYPIGWHAIGQDSRRAASGLASFGLIEADDSRPRRYRLALAEDARAILAATEEDSGLAAYFARAMATDAERQARGRDPITAAERFASDAIAAACLFNKESS